jgi:hypothetical protein
MLEMARWISGFASEVPVQLVKAGSRSGHKVAALMRLYRLENGVFLERTDIPAARLRLACHTRDDLVHGEVSGRHAP